MKRADWLQNSNIYEVNLRQYTQEGTFNAFVHELPRLRSMGVEILWFMPMTPISQKNKKGELGSYYASSDYVSLNPEFGTAEDLHTLLQSARSMGFKIVMDWVANHTGWDHVWTRDHPEYFLKDPVTGDFKMASGMEDIIELDFSNADLRKAMIAAMEFWVREFDIDGFRCDLAFWVCLDFWVEARFALEKHKTLFWLGEFDPLDNPEYCTVFDAGYTWTWMHKTEKYYKEGQGLDILKKVLLQYDNTCGTRNIPVWFTSNHDENSWNGTEYEKYGDMARALAVFSFTWHGMPMIYSGQELPNTKRLEFFEKDMIGWNGAFELQEFYTILLHLHKNNPALRAADPAVGRRYLKTTADDSILAYERQHGESLVLVLLNFTGVPVSFFITDGKSNTDLRDVFLNRIAGIGEQTCFELESWGYRVYEK